MDWSCFTVDPLPSSNCGGGRDFAINTGIQQGFLSSGVHCTQASEPLTPQQAQPGMGGCHLEEEGTRYPLDWLLMTSQYSSVNPHTESQPGRAWSANVNWAKCGGYAIGQWIKEDIPKRLAELEFKCLGFFLGCSDFWGCCKGLVEKIWSTLSCWMLVLAQFSYSVGNNITASMLHILLFWSHHQMVWWN